MILHLPVGYQHLTQLRVMTELFCHLLGRKGHRIFGSLRLFLELFPHVS